MFTNFFKTAFRNMLRNKGMAFINIFGLAIGMTCCLLILLFVRDETSFDKQHKDNARVYRVVKDFVNDDGSRLPDATTPPALAPAMQNEIPEIEKVTRVFPSWGYKNLVQAAEKKFLEERFFRVDSSFFEVFTFPLVRGEVKSVFKELNSVVITETISKKYFGSDDPMGKILKTDIGDLAVTGVLKDVPENNHFHFDFLVSIRKLRGNTDLQWGWYNFYTYVKLKQGTDIATVVPKVQAIYKKNNAEGTNIFHAQALTDIHLSSNLKWELEPNSDKLYVYVFSVIALFVILIACINYINLATSRSSLRAKEIGVRKVTGANKSSLVKQFLIESVITSCIAFVIALSLAFFILPAMNQLTQKHLDLFNKENSGLLIGGLGAAIGIGLIAGIYPALFLSSFKPLSVIKGMKMTERGAFNLRKALVVLQFSISVILITGTIIIIRQVNYVQDARLGINKDQVMIIQGTDQLGSRANYATFKNELLEIPAVKNIAGADGVVGGQNWTNGLTPKGSDKEVLVNFLSVGYDYFNVMGMEFKEGRSFSEKFPGDTLQDGLRSTTDRNSGGIILNETAVKDFQLRSPVIGQQIAWAENDDTTYYVTVVGVVKDFHFTSLRNEIKPFAFVVEPPRENLVMVKLAGSDMRSTIATIEKKWTKYSPDRPFQYSFLDETYSKLYQSERRFNKVFLYLTGLAILIACLGLFGLAAFTAEQRTREIGIRKVVGASVSGIVTLLSKDFVILVLISIVIALPIAWYTMNKWLHDFAYRVNIEWWVFVLAAVIAILIALATVSFQAIRAAVANPVKSLKAE